MCYKPVIANEADASVGVRELRQNLSVYLERVATGTVFRDFCRREYTSLAMCSTGSGPVRRHSIVAAFYEEQRVMPAS